MKIRARFWILLCMSGITHNALAADNDTLKSTLSESTFSESGSKSHPATQDTPTTNAQSTTPPSSKAAKKLPAALITTTLAKDPLVSPLNVEFSGKDTPLHSGDVAKSLLLVPGFSMARKGGGGSEAFFRSQGASRLPIFLSGSSLNGACGGRMDTTITYTFPENYDKISIFKGPQDVRYGALIAGGILFERDILRLKSPTFKAASSALYGSFNRFDFNASALAGGSLGSLQAIYSHYGSSDYHSGDGALVHSAYNRQSLSLIGTLTPTSSSALELDIDLGRGFASYADRAMDARTFDRSSFGLKYQQHFASAFDLLDIRAWRNEIDHIMDNFSHRPVAGDYKLNNPKRTNTGARLEGRFYPTDEIEIYLGSSYSRDFHALRSGSGASKQDANAALSLAYKPNFSFDNAALFAQGSYLPQGVDSGLFFGARYDFLLTQKLTTSESSQDHLGSGFVRYERYFDNLSAYAGVGFAQRAADFWERSKAQGMALRAEGNTQFDLGLSYQASKSRWWRLSGYGAYVNDYILLHYGTATNAHNTNAMLLGAELEGEYSFFDMLHLYGSLAYTYGENLKNLYGTDYALAAHAPLPQIAPLQGQLSLFITHNVWFWRVDGIFNATQNRYALDFGNVVGKDLGKGEGFMLLNLYGGVELKWLSLQVGVDNLTNTHYAYHLSKSGVDIGALGIEATRRVYEPGRSYWGKLKVRF